MNDHRAAHVQEYVTLALAPILTLDLYALADWTGHRNGWEPPVLHEGIFVFHYCPELIALHTMDQHVDDADDYLQAIVAVAGLHVIRHAVPDDQRVAVVEADLMEKAPASLALLSAMEMAILDGELTR